MPFDIVLPDSVGPWCMYTCDDSKLEVQCCLDCDIKNIFAHLQLQPFALSLRAIFARERNFKSTRTMKLGSQGKWSEEFPIYRACVYWIFLSLLVFLYCIRDFLSLFLFAFSFIQLLAPYFSLLILIYLCYEPFLHRFCTLVSPFFMRSN